MLTFDAAPDELQLFLEEAEEQLQLLDQDIVLLEKDGTRPELLQEIFRAAHTLKGSSAAIGHTKMASLTHSMENVLDHLRHGTLASSTVLIDVLLQSLDGLRLLKEEVVTLQDGGFDPNELVSRLNALVSGINANLGNMPVGVAAPPPAPSAPAPDSSSSPAAEAADGCIRVVIKIADDSPLLAARCLQGYLEASRFGEVVESKPSLQSIENQEAGHRLEMVVQGVENREDMIVALEALPDVVEVTSSAVGNQVERDAAQPQAAPEMPGGAGGPAPAAAPDGKAAPANSSAPSNGKVGAGLGKTVRIDVARLDDLVNLVGELVIDRTRLSQLGGQLQSKYEDESISELSETSQHIGRIVDELQEGIMKARMLPIAGLFNRLPRVVRDLAQRSGKKVDFVMEGEETELDRSVIEELNDPLVHLLRNALDHGVETPDKRTAAGKAEIGQVKLSAMHKESRILLRVEDDGNGIDPARIRRTAVSKGVLSQEVADRMSDQEAMQLIFAAGFSTAEKITDISGRGVGMDIVRSNIEKLNGSVTVESWNGKGTRFTLELPLTLAIIDALMVGLGDQVLAVPLISVVETLRVRRSEIQWVNKHQTIQLRDTILPLIGLDDALGLHSANKNTDRVFVVAVRVGEHQVGLVVDSLLGELQVVIKSLGRRVGNLAGITGATILGDGRVALILDVPSLVKCVMDEQARGVTA